MDLNWAVGLNATALHCWKTPQGQPRKAGGGRPHYWHGTQTTTSFEQPLWWYMSVSNTLPVELIGVLPFQKPCAGGRHLPTAIWRAERLKRNYNMKKRLNRENRVSGCANQAIWPEKFLGSVCTGERGGIRSRPPQFGARDCSSLGEFFLIFFSQL